MPRDPICHMDVDEARAIVVEDDGMKVYFCSRGCRDKFISLQGQKETHSVYELIIIGGGPAGLSAAVYAARLNVHTLVIFKDLGGQAVDSTQIENYMGFDFITGPELVEKFQDQLIHSNYVDHKVTEVEGIEKTEAGFHITASGSVSYTTTAVIVATGMTRRKLGVPGEEEFQRRGVFYGNIQDLSFVQGKDVVLTGGGNTAVQILDNLHSVARKTSLVAPRFSADPAVLKSSPGFAAAEKYEGWKIIRIVGDDSGPTEVHLRNNAGDEEKVIPAQGVFIAIGLVPNSSLVAGLTSLNERGEILIHPDCSTEVPGLFAAGDVTNAFGKRIVIASGEGAKAAMAARQYILSSDRPV